MSTEPIRIRFTEGYETPKWKPGTKEILIPGPGYRDYSDLGWREEVDATTAHEFGHSIFKHQNIGLQDYEYSKKLLKSEVEATVWAASRRGFTPGLKRILETLFDDFVEYGDVAPEEFVQIVDDAIEAVNAKRSLKLRY